MWNGATANADQHEIKDGQEAMKRIFDRYAVSICFFIFICLHHFLVVFLLCRCTFAFLHSSLLFVMLFDSPFCSLLAC